MSAAIRLQQPRCEVEDGSSAAREIEKPGRLGPEAGRPWVSPAFIIKEF